MVKVEREIDRYLTLLRNKIHERQFTQLEVQEALGWGRSYISQLLTKQKALRLEQILAILHTIGVEPRAFFAELYAEDPRLGAGRQPPPGSSDDLPPDQLERMLNLARGLSDLLRRKGLITEGGLSKAVAAVNRELERG